MGTYLSRTPGSAGNRKTMTFSCWVKRSGLSSFQSIISAGTNGATYSDDLSFQSSDTLMLDLITTSGRYQAQSSALFRDTASWYHVVVAINTTAASNRMLVYVNNEQVAVNSGGIPQNQDITFNNNTLQEIGRRGSNSSNFGSYYLTDFNFIDGQALTPSTFGETDSTTGEWKPKVDFTGLTYGTNGFRLQFGNAAALGTDTSGQSNNFTVNSAGTNAKTVDTASNNFVTWNPLVNRSFQYPMTLSEGNLKVIADSNASFGSTMAGTVSLGKGKWYWEFKYTTSGTGGYVVGWGEDTYNFNYQADAYPYKGDLGSSSGVFYRADGGKAVNSVESSGAGDAWAQNDIIGVAADFDASTITFYNQGVSQFTVTSAFTSTVKYYPEFYGYGSKGGQANFGNPPYTIASGNADANGYGNFEYAVPSGYYALCTKNINQYG